MLLSIILKYFNEKKKISFYELKKKTGKDRKSLKAWSDQKNQHVQTKSFDAVVNTLQNEIAVHFNDFSEYTLSVLENNSIIREYVQEIFDDNKSIQTIIDQLLLLDFSEGYYLQDRIGTKNIIQKAKVLLSPFRDYFQVSEQVIHDNENGLEPTYAPLIYSSGYTSQPIHGGSQLNYLILKFPNAYHVGILLSNYLIDYSDTSELGYFSYMIDRLKSSNNLSMILFVTDIDKKSVSFSVQSALMEKHNLFFDL